MVGFKVVQVVGIDAILITERLLPLDLRYYTFVYIGLSHGFVCNTFRCWTHKRRSVFTLQFVMRIQVGSVARMGDANGTSEEGVNYLRVK